MGNLCVAKWLITPPTVQVLVVKSTHLLLPVQNCSRSQWPCGLRRVSDAPRLLGLRVRIPSGLGCLSLANVVCCQVQFSAATGWSLVQRSLTECRVSVIAEPLQWTGLSPLRLSSNKKNKELEICVHAAPREGECTSWRFFFFFVILTFIDVGFYSGNISELAICLFCFNIQTHV